MKMRNEDGFEIGLLTHREADRDVVARRAGGDDITLRRVDEVVLRAARAAHDVEGVLQIACQCRVLRTFRERGTYAVQVEGVGGTGRRGGSRERELDRRVGRQSVHAAGGQEVLGGVGAAHDLEQDRHGGRHKAVAVDEEVGAVLTR